MERATAELLGFHAEQTVHKTRTCLTLNEWVAQAQLAILVGAHRIAQVRCREQDSMLGAARYRRYRDVVGAESGDAMVCILGTEA